MFTSVTFKFSKPHSNCYDYYQADDCRNIGLLLWAKYQAAAIQHHFKKHLHISSSAIYCSRIWSLAMDECSGRVIHKPKRFTTIMPFGCILKEEKISLDFCYYSCVFGGKYVSYSNFYCRLFNVVFLNFIFFCFTHYDYLDYTVNVADNNMYLVDNITFYCESLL